MSLDLTSDYLQFNFSMPEGSKNGVYSFDGFKLDAGKLMLYRDDAELALPPKVVKTLAVLIENRGVILSKDELIEKVWSDAIVEESNLSQYLYLLRKTLGKKPDGTAYIETLRRRGYRFTAEVTTAEIPTKPPVITTPGANRLQIPNVERQGNVLRLVEWAAPNRAETAEADAIVPARPARTVLTVGLLAAVILVVGLTAAAFVFYRGASVTQKPEARSEMNVVRLTNGVVPIGATISADGNYFAYIVQDGDIFRLYLQETGQSSRLEIASSSDKVFYASTLSPDGKFIYVLTALRSSGAFALYRVPAIGGPMAKVLDDIGGPVSFSPDGSEMVFLRSNKSGDTTALIIADKDGKDQRVLLEHGSGHQLGNGPAWSPDGSTIAVSEFRMAGESGDGTNRIILVNRSDGSAKDLSNETWDTVYRMAWTFDGSAIALIGTRANEAYTPRRDQVYLVSYPEGISRRLTTEGNRNEPNSLGIAKNGSLIAVPGNRSAQIWSMDVKGDQSTAFQVTRGAADGRAGLCPLPDGRLAFMARTAEEFNIWLSGADGSDPQQIATGLPIVEELRADPNGKFLVFSAVVDRQSHLYRVDTDGNNVRQITSGASEIDSAVSPDGANVAFGSVRLRNGVPVYVLMKVSANGGEPESIGSAECSRPSYSHDGSMISCIGEHEEVMVLDASTGDEIERFRPPANALTNFGAVWLPDASGVALIINEKNSSNIWVFPLKKREPYRLTNFSSGMIFRFAFAPDGSRLFVARGYPVQDAILITNYR